MNIRRIFVFTIYFFYRNHILKYTCNIFIIMNIHSTLDIFKYSKIYRTKKNIPHFHLVILCKNNPLQLISIDL